MDSRDFLVEECQALPLQAETSKSPNSSQEFDPSTLVEAPQGKVLHAKNWFLTFPKTDTSKDSALSQLQAKFKESLKGVLVAQEQHKDGECSSRVIGLALGVYPL